MAKLLVYYAHPGHKHSHANKAMVAEAQKVDGITFVDLYAEYPRFEIDIDREQQRLLDHDVILFQFPMFWYSTPSLIKEWQDLVLEHGFAYGAGGDKLAGKCMMLAVTAAGPQDAYAQQGYQKYPIRTFLTPLEQTARLCHMEFSAPYALYGSLCGGLIMAEILLLAFLFLIAGVIVVPIASRLGLGSVLGYLLAGIAISPLLKQLHVDVVSIQHFAEFGVVMMLFLVGLELEPRLLWRMRNKLLGLGGLQVGVTVAIVMGVADSGAGARCGLQRWQSSGAAVVNQGRSGSVCASAAERPRL
jgi:glutathione-regulated potassium-efflux system ancillary protein KefG